MLLSGGLDSAVTLYFALKQGFKCVCLAFDYGQRHKKELNCAKKIARVARSPLEVIKITLPWKGSALLDKDMAIPSVTNRSAAKRIKSIPPTYVPARNIIFLSFALSYAETKGAGAIFIGAHAEDYSGYPDCRPEFYRAFARVVKTGTKAGVSGKSIRVITPLVYKGKSEIILLGQRLGVPFGLSWSCYRGGRRPCGKCDSCYFRAKGFLEAGISDPLSTEQ